MYLSTFLVMFMGKCGVNETNVPFSPVGMVHIRIHE